MHIVEGQCTIGTAYKWITQPTTIEECCSLCAADAGKCSGFTLRNDTASRTSPGKVTCSLKTGPLGRTRPGCIASGSVAPLPPPPSPSPPPPSPSPPKPPPASGLTVSDMLLGVGGAVPVLQRNTAVSIWGTAVPGAVVKVELVGCVCVSVSVRLYPKTPLGLLKSAPQKTPLSPSAVLIQTLLHDSGRC